MILTFTNALSRIPARFYGKYNMATILSGLSANG